MTLPADRRVGLGILLAMAGLLLQMAASLFWSPAAFLLSAGVGLPLVVAGVVTLWTGMRGAGPAPEAGAGLSARNEP
jgi:hypothetical protein